MRAKILVLGLTFLFLIACEGTPENPYSPTPPAEPEPPPAADIIFYEGGIAHGFNGFCHGPSGPPYIRSIDLSGVIKNVGNAIAENIYIHVKCYDILNTDNLLWTGSYFFIHEHYNESHLEPGQIYPIDIRWEIDCAVLDGNFYDDYTWVTEITWENIT